MALKRIPFAPFHLVLALLFAAVFISYIDRTNISVASIAMQAELGWSETDKGLVLSAFFIGYISLMIVSGVLANRYGGKWVLGLAVIWWSVFTILTPLAASISLPVLVMARIALGVGEAAVFPASINMVGRWVPAEFRSRAVALFASAIALGTVFSLPVTGWLVREFDWPMAFYVFGAVGFVWAAVWFAKVSNGRGVETTVVANQPASIPWARLLRLPAIWAIIINHFCHNWALYVLLAWLPSYFTRTFGVSLANAGLLSAAPWLVNFITANVAAFAADRMIKAGRSATFVRKLMQSVGLGGAAAFLLLLQGASDATTGMLLMCGATGSMGLTFAGFGPNAFDVAPRYADVIWGISNTAATLPGILGVWITGFLIDATGNYTAPFVVTAGVCLFGALVYLAIGSGQRHID